MVACVFQQGGPCMSTFAYAETAHGKAQNLSGLFRKAGKTCMDFQGYCEETCDDNGDNCVAECTAAKNIDPFQALADADILGWIVSNWYIVISVEVGCALMAFFIRWYARRKGGRITFQRAKTIRQKLMRGGTAGGTKNQHIVRTDKTGGVIVEVERKKASDYVADAALHRLQVLFPSTPSVVVSRIIKSSPHEEAAVFRLLHLGYPMHMIQVRPQPVNGCIAQNVAWLDSHVTRP